MNPIDQQLAIAEAHGYVPTPEGNWTRNPSGRGTPEFPTCYNLPDYLGDRNAIHEALYFAVMGNHGLFSKWCQHLVDIVIRDSPTSTEGDLNISDVYTPVEMCGAVALATCKQFAESLLKTLDLWTDE